MPDISKLNAIAIADVAKVDGLAKASILNIDGVAVPSAVPPPLDTYTGAAAAYSVRLLRTAYTGSCMRVREDGGNTETDIGFDSNGDLDTAAIASHCGANNGFIRYWYDQSGNAVDAGQATQTSQPKIYDSSTGIIEEGAAGKEKPALDFDGSTNFLATSTTTWSDGDVHFCVLQTKGIGGGDVWSCAHTSPFLFRYASNSTNRFFLAYMSLQYQIIENTGSTVQELATCEIDNGTQAYYANGTSLGSQSVTGGISTSSNFVHIGKRATGNFFTGNIQEIIHWGTGRSADRIGIETNIDLYYQIPGM